MNPRYVNEPGQFVKTVPIGYRREMVEGKMTEIPYGPMLIEIDDGSNASSKLLLSFDNAKEVYRQLGKLLLIRVAIGILRRVRVGGNEYEYLVGKISSHRKHAGKWEFPGGKQDETDATLEDALKREWMEELGVEVRVGHQIHQAPYPHDPDFVTLHFFSVSLDPGDDDKIQCKDHQEIAFKTTAELQELDVMEVMMKTDLHVALTAFVGKNGNH